MPTSRTDSLVQLIHKIDDTWIYKPITKTITLKNPSNLFLSPGSMLKEGGSATVGQAMGFNINSKDAGPGQLYVRCQGPSKDCDVTVFDNKDSTYQVQIFPTEVGNHLVYVEWGGRPVHGSPFLVRVGQPPDPSKVRVYGKWRSSNETYLICNVITGRWTWK